jgi:ribose transport system ATP-binding protein
MIGEIVASPAAGIQQEAGQAAQAPAATAADAGRVRLAVRDLHTAALRGVSMAVRDGELVGLGGLRGQGQEDLLLAAFGALPYAGQIEVGGARARFQHPKEAVQAGVAYVPGERNAQGLLSIRSILENLQLPSWARYGMLLRMAAARRDAARVAADLRLVMAGLDAPVSSLSGGNAQKVVLGKWLLRAPTLLLLNDPTKGVDVGAKGEIYRLLADLRQAGAAILFYSTDDEELLGLCDRVLVLHDGRVRAELVAGDTLTRGALIAASVGAEHAHSPSAATPEPAGEVQA